MGQTVSTGSKASELGLALHGSFDGSGRLAVTPSQPPRWDRCCTLKRLPESTSYTRSVKSCRGHVSEPRYPREMTPVLRGQAVKFDNKSVWGLAVYEIFSWQGPEPRTGVMLPPK